jgi:AGCS family alanine or glycine:cation symporter
MDEGTSGAALTNKFCDFHIIGPIVLTLGLLTFVFSTILGWSYYGEKAAEYLFGNKVIKPYRYLWVLFVMIGSVLSLNVVWTFADITNALMALPNLVSLIFLSGVIVNETKKYLWNDNLDEEGE